MGMTYGLSAVTSEIIIKDGVVEERFDLLGKQNSASMLVEAKRAEIYGELNGVALFRNLSICTDLFGVAYLAVDGMEGLQSAVLKLRQKMNMVAINSADDYINGFLLHIDKAKLYYEAALKALFKEEPDVDKTMKLFGKIAAEATCIQNGAQELTIKFQELTEDATEITGKMIDARALDISKRQELEDNVQSIKAQLAGLKKLQEDLDDEIKELTEEYQRLEKKIDKASNQQFWMGITSMITGAVGAGIAAYTSSTTAGMVNNVSQKLADGGKDNSSATGMATLQNAQEKVTKIDQELQEKNALIESLEKSVKELDEKLKTALDTEKETLLSEKKRVSDKLEVEKQNKRTLEGQKKSYTEVLQGLAVGLSTMSEKMDQKSQKLEDAVAALSEMADGILAKKSALRKEKREILQKVAEHTQTVENAVVSKKSLDLAVAALSAGVGAMNYIVSVLNDFYKFWIRVTATCKQLASGTVRDYLEIYEDDVEELQALDTRLMLANNLCQWYALYIVMKEYQDGFHLVHEKLQEQLKIEQDKDPEKMWEKAIQMSKGMSELISIQADGVIA